MESIDDGRFPQRHSRLGAIGTSDVAIDAPLQRAVIAPMRDPLRSALDATTYVASHAAHVSRQTRSIVARVAGLTR